ncbi:hypothetical protein Pan44_21590 [Caulifigura coniformis]|uniref:Immunoglobulin G-binding protein A n=1 Tax=Caulifigura coniformis TaxID=2527983 RepID=A0A517SDC4_9PLAN|nr:hypothetical protein [Caulifigura coniformis]QDT54132.1 hypothetical protein Pan44_21590 [Caulifigura coniformis]
MPKSAAEATPPAGNRFVEFDEFIDYQLNKTSKSIQSTDVLVGVVGAALGVTLYLFAFIVADHWLVTGGLGLWARIAFWSVGTVALGYWIVTRLLRPLNSRVNVLFAARQIERTQPGLKSSLLTLTDLKQSGRTASGQILGSLEKRAAVGLSKADVEEAVDRSALMTSSYALLFLLATFCGYALFSPKSILQSAWRAIAPFTSTGVATRTRIDRVNPGNAEVPALAHLEIEVETSGQAPQEATLYYTTADGAFVDEALPLRDSGEGLRRYRGTLIGPDGRGLRQNLTYHVVAGDARSETYTVNVIESPAAVVDGVDYEYLPYTGVSNKSEPGGAIDAWEGTRVTVNATANRKVKSAMLLFSDTEDTSVKAEELPMLVADGTKLKVSWQLALRRDGSFPRFYRVQLVTEENHQDPQPTLQPLNIRPDLPPRVEVLYPKSDLQAPVNGVVEIAYRASDPDFKLRSLVLNLEHDGQVLVSSPRLFTGPPDEESRQGTYKLRLAELNLAAGSRLTYWIEARDNFEPFADRGINRSFTPRLNIDLVAPKPPAETRKQEEQASKDAQEALDQARPDQPQPAGAEDNGAERPDGAQGASESKPPSDPDQAEQRPGTENNPGQKPENSTPGEKPSPMPGDAAQNPPHEQQPPQEQQQPNGAQQQQPSRENTGEKQEGKDGAAGDKTASGESKPGAEQRPGDQGRDRNGSQGSNSDQKGNDGQPSGPREQAPDDTQIQKLIDWHKKQTEREQSGNKPGEADPSKPNESNPQESKPQDDAGKPGEKGPDGRSPQTEPGADPSSPMKGEEDAAPGKPGEKRDGQQDNKTSKSDGSKSEGETTSKGEPGGTPSGQPMQKPSAKGEQPSPDNRQGTESGKPGMEDSPSTSPDQKNQPGTGDNSSSKKPDGNQASTPSDPAAPGQPGAKPDAGQKPGSTPMPGAPSADQTENSAQSPMGDRNAPGDKATSNERKPADQDNANTGAKGQDSPDGKSGDRTQPGEQKPGAQEKPGNSSQKPVGQNDDMGTREQGMGDPGSSKPGETGGQKTPGQGEAGKNGESSKTGEKSGTGKSENGSKSSQPGSKEGGDSKGDGSSKPQDDGSAKGADQSGKGNNSPMSDSPQDGGQKPGEKGGDEKSSQEQDSGKQGGDQKQGGSDDKAGGDQKGGDQKQGGGDQKGGEQKQGGQDSKDGGGQSSKPGGDNASGKQSSSGEGGDPKPGMSSGAKPGAGGAGSSGPGAAAAEGAQGEGSGGESTAEAANLENRKKATNLALKRLQETLERGDIDPELQKELGFTDDELRSFMDRLEERLADTGDDNSPEAQARRRQFEQLLKGIDLQTQTSKRAAGTGEGPSTSGFGTSGRPAPAEYRAAEKRYRESLNKKK